MNVTVKTIALNLTSATLGAAMLMSLIPLSANAQQRSPVGERGDFCENISTAREETQTRLSEQREKMDQRGDADTRKEERLADLESRRDEDDAKREARYDQLRELATSDAKTTAVADFIETVDELVTARRAAIDDAIATFESGVEALLENRSASLKSAADDFASDIDAVFDDAESACDDGDTSAEVRQAFMADMQALREAQQAKRSEYALKDELEALRAARRSATEAALGDFKAGLDEAKATLRGAFEAE